MKKFLFLFFAMLLSLTTWAAAFTDNSTGTTIYYNIVTGGVAVTYGDAISSPSDNTGTEEYVGDITIPSSVTYEGTEYQVVAIGASAFRACSSLTGVEIPETVTELGQYAFRMSSITELTIPGTVTTMGTYTFYQCTSLESAIIEEGVTTLAQYMFDGCTALETVSLPSTLETMNTYTFDGCTKLHDVVLPDGLSSIGNYSFRNCSSLTSINIPSSLTTTSTYLFSGSGLTSIDLPDNITSVGNYSFYNCTALKTAKIGKNVGSVGASAFAGCTALEAVYSYRAEYPTAQSGSFTSVPTSCILYVPEGSTASYSVATGWNHFILIEEMSAEPTSFTITDVGYATYYTDVEYVMPAGVTGTTVTSVTKDSADDGIDYVLTMNWEYTEGSVVPANTALVLQGNEGSYEYETSSTSAEAPTDNLLMGSISETTTTGPNGEDEGYVFYELSTGSHGVGFYYGKEEGAAFTSGANKAWLPLSESQATNARFLGFGKGDDTTGISSIENSSENTVNGIYTIQGVRVSNTNQPGLYIVDGKKVLVK